MSAVLEAPASVAEARMLLLVDPGSFLPVRTAVGDGVLAGTGRVHGRPVAVWAQDGSFKGGSLGAAGGATIAQTIERAGRDGVPVVGFPHSGGARLQEGTGALHAYGTIFRAQVRAAVPQVSVIGGPCAGGAAYSPALGDLTVMAGEGARMFLTGPGVVRAVCREDVTAEDLGGPRHQARTGVTHAVVPGDVEAAVLVRDVLAHLPQRAGGGLPLHPPADPAAGDPAGALPASPRQVYDVREVVARLVDGGTLTELGARWARNLVVGLARVDGRPVGVVANQPRHLGGCLDAEAAQKGAWFVSLCARFGVPLVVLVDTPGFLPGLRQERAGVIRHGASLLQAFAAADVPIVTVVLRAAYGGAHICMASRALSDSLALAWPGARIGVMGEQQVATVLRGVDPDAYAAEHLPAEAAARRGVLDEVVAPCDTRRRIAWALEARG